MTSRYLIEKEILKPRKHFQTTVPCCTQTLVCLFSCKTFNKWACWTLSMLLACHDALIICIIRCDFVFAFSNPEWMSFLFFLISEMCTDVHAAVTGETGCQSFQKMTVTSRQIQSDTFKRRLKTRTYFKIMGTFKVPVLLKMWLLDTGNLIKDFL